MRVRKWPSANSSIEGRWSSVKSHARVNEQLERELRAALFACHQGDNGRKVATRAVPTNRKALRIDAELRGVIGDIAGCCVRVLDSSGEGMFGSEPVVHSNHGAAGLVGERAAFAIVRVETCQSPSHHRGNTPTREESRWARAGKSGRGWVVRAREWSGFSIRATSVPAPQGQINAAPVARASTGVIS